MAGPFMNAVPEYARRPEVGAAAPMSPSLVKLIRRASELGWRCLARTWNGYHARYAFECPNGHLQERQAVAVTYGIPVCRHCEADAIRDRWMATLARRGGELVEGTFTGLEKRYRLRCAKGHEWEAQGGKIAGGYWCPGCRNERMARRHLRADGLERLQVAAREKGGRCLTTEYTGGSGYYPFECALGHRWSAQGAEIVRGQWCPGCKKKVIGAKTGARQFYRDGLQRLQEAARQHGGTCLATTYTGAKSHYPFRCAHGHGWEARANQVWYGKWCRECYWDSLKHSIQEMQALARSHGGECVSSEYVDTRTKLQWRCERGHAWSTRPAVIIRGGGWCPLCANLERSKKRGKRLKYDFEG